MNSRYLIWVFLFLLMASACHKQENIETPKEPYLVIPDGFPYPEFPEDNQFSDERWELGKKLFFDPIMSRDGKVSCGSCHMPQNSFSDTLSVSLGVDLLKGTRNSPSLANVAYHPYFTREGGVPSLEMQVLVPIQEHNEFDTNILEIADLLKADTTYQRMASEAYDREPDHYVISRALATFERSIISGNSNYDRYYFQGDKSALSEVELKGMDLFYSDRTNCSACHSGFNFSDYSFQNNGIYGSYADAGRFRLTNDEKDIAKFKVPSLRNIEKTAPYMHDGSMKTLIEVVAHYNSGGKSHPNKNEILKPLNLSETEQNALVMFLMALTDSDFIRNEKFRP